jgi:hypothetical protein
VGKLSFHRAILPLKSHASSFVVTFANELFLSDAEDANA